MTKSKEDEKKKDEENKKPKNPKLTLTQLIQKTSEQPTLIVGALVNAGLQKAMEKGEPLISLTDFKTKLKEFKGKEVK